MTTRRRFIRNGMMLGAGAALLPRGIAWADTQADAKAGALEAAVASSPLVYISPLRSDGQESACHAEVWFVPDGNELLVVTAAEAWRATAIGKGIDQARLWVGDFGVWKRANGKYLEAPGFDATASLVTDSGAHAKALETFGQKYAAAWGSWGPKFRNGLASGERVMIRYAPKGS